MRKNALRQALQGGKPVFGTMLQESRSSAVPELMAAAGCDFIFIDMEHGAFNMETVADLIKVTRLTGMTPLVRVPDDQYHLVARVLDAGAQGIMVPLPRLFRSQRPFRLSASALAGVYPACESRKHGHRAD